MGSVMDGGRGGSRIYFLGGQERGTDFVRVAHRNDIFSVSYVLGHNKKGGGAMNNRTLLLTQIMHKTV